MSDSDVLPSAPAPLSPIEADLAFKFINFLSSANPVGVPSSSHTTMFLLALKNTLAHSPQSPLLLAILNPPSNEHHQPSLAHLQSDDFFTSSQRVREVLGVIPTDTDLSSGPALDFHHQFHWLSVFSKGRFPTDVPLTDWCTKNLFFLKIRLKQNHHPGREQDEAVAYFYNHILTASLTKDLNAPSNPMGPERSACVKLLITNVFHNFPLPFFYALIKTSWAMTKEEASPSSQKPQWDPQSLNLALQELVCQNAQSASRMRQAACVQTRAAARGGEKFDPHFLLALLMLDDLIPDALAGAMWTGVDEGLWIFHGADFWPKDNPAPKARSEKKQILAQVDQDVQSKSQDAPRPKKM